MKEVKINPNNLIKEELDDIKYKARALIFNDREELLLTVNGGVYLLPGGSINSNETYIDAVKREVLEETGIQMKEDKIFNLASYEEYVKDFPKRDGITFVSRYTKTVYYYYDSLEDVHEDKMELSINEKNGKFSYLWINPKNIAAFLLENQDINNLKRPYFDRELMTIINEYLEVKNSYKNILANSKTNVYKYKKD